MSTTSRSCALRCLSRRLGDVSDACGRPRVQELSSEASWHLVFTRRASTPWSCFGSKGSPLSAMRSRGGLCMSVMGAGDLCEGPCRLVHAVCVLASASSRKCHCGFSRVLLAFVNLSYSVVPACRNSYRVNAYSLSGGGSIDWVPGVVPAAWGGPRRAWRAVRAAPKTGN